MPVCSWHGFAEPSAHSRSDAFQQDANEALEAGSNGLVAAPDGAGKTVVADFAIYLATARNVKAFSRRLSRR